MAWHPDGRRIQMLYCWLLRCVTVRKRKYALHILIVRNLFWSITCACYGGYTSVESKIRDGSCIGQATVIEILKASWWATTIPVLTCVLGNMNCPRTSCSCVCINQSHDRVTSWAIRVQDHWKNFKLIAPCSVFTFIHCLCSYCVDPCLFHK